MRNPTNGFCLQQTRRCGVYWSMDSAPSTCAADTVSANLRMILRGLLAALGAWRLEPVLALVLYGRINRTLGRIERMLVRFRAGKLWRMPHRGVAPGRTGHRNATVRSPRRFGWLVQLGGHQAACVGLQLQTVVHTPEMVELLAVSAQAARILQPLCRALAVELPTMTGTMPHDLTDDGTTKRRRTRPRAVPEPFRIPLPRGVLTAARRQAFGKDR